MIREASPHDAAPVAIVGAGPVGLALALGLARHGIRSCVVERKPATSPHSRAPGIHARTLEIFRQWNIEERMLREGTFVPKLTLHDAARPGRHLLDLDFSRLSGETARAGMLILEQGRTEAVLLDAVRESGACDVRFATEAIDLGSDGGRPRLTLRCAEGESVLAADFLIGCDGAGSFVRRTMEQPFDGITYSLRPMLADVELFDRRDGLPWPRLRSERGGLTIAIRLRAHLWRIIRLETEERAEADEVPDDEVRQRVEAVLGTGPFERVWASRFRIHRRSSPTFRMGRVLLAGDAAHVHSPVGGQGMNAGIQDAHNLAWKLAAALRGGDVERLLDSYDVERRAAVVEGVSRFTDILTRALLQTPAPVRRAGFFALRSMLRVTRVRSAMLRRTAMLDVRYGSSPLLDREDRASGRRLPDVTLLAPDGESSRLHGILPEGPAIIEMAEQGSRAELPLEAVVRIAPDAYREPAGVLSSLLDGGDGWILVRPDRHIAWAVGASDDIAGRVRHSLGGDWRVP